MERRKAGSGPPTPRRGAARPATSHPEQTSQWIWGLHAAAAAIANPRRHLHRILATANVAHQLADVLAAAPRPAEILPPERLAALLPPGAVHQGLAVAVAPLPEVALEEVLDAPRLPTSPPPLLFLDQVTDPQNVGAILRAAAAFGAGAVVLTRRHAPPLSGALAKAASGALEHVPLVRVPNLAQALAAAGTAGWRRIGLAGEAALPLAGLDVSGPLALVLGAEGPGLRRLTRERCDLLAALPTRPAMPSLNVAAAAAVALYEFARRTL